MAYTNTISGLKARRVEIMQELDRLRAETAKLTNDRTAIEQVLRSFGCTDFQEAPRAYNITFERGQLYRLVCDHLRQHGKATSREITLAIISALGKDPDDRGFYGMIQKAASRCLANMRQRGQATRSGVCGAYEWRLAA